MCLLLIHKVYYFRMMNNEQGDGETEEDQRFVFAVL